jgi:tRNA(adenine34) deaminase
MFSDQDRHFMGLALDEARMALEAGDFAVGAALAIDDELVGTGRNALVTNQDWASHAEAPLLVKHSSQIQKRVREDGLRPTLYTTLEPCLMCLGTILVHRVGRLVIACPDPSGGTTHLDPAAIGAWYAQHWPQVETGLYREEAYQLIVTSLRNSGHEAWLRLLAKFKAMHRQWQSS